VCLAVYKSGLELVLTHEGAERAAYVQEKKDVLIRCPQPLVGDRPGQGRPQVHRVVPGIVPVPPPAHPACARRRGCLECG
jgi:hypothetical protein